ncbi:preprotein translocase subunit SecY [Candidatus Bathyarchaeota archaeon]|nr:preprotein translocase subunit SecY [Candidatus Bathyarchaeota archaeon]
MAGRFLQIFKPLQRFLPEVSSPERRVRIGEKLLWTVLALVLYLIMTEVPLYGIQTGGEDPYLYLRVIFASNRGSLMELGIQPIVTAGLILQIVAGSGLISFDQSDPNDRKLFTTASKFFSLVLIGVQASAYLIGGVYGTLEFRVAIIIFIQLMVAGIVLMLLDEMIQKGWGMGSGISLFILAGVAQRILWSSVAPWPPMYTGQKYFYGALIAFIQAITNGEPLGEAITRPWMPSISMLGFITTIAVFLIVIYIEGVRVEIPVAYARYRGFRGTYPIKLLYVSNLPVIFASALFANVYLVSQLLWSRFYPNTPFWVNLLGQYQYSASGQPEPIGGLVYYVISPRSIPEVINDPVRALVFVGILVSFCVIFSLIWLQMGGQNPQTVARQLVDSGMQIPGFRRSHKPIENILKRYIPGVTVLGGIIVGLISAVADFFGVFGTGMGVLLSVGILYQYYQLLMREQVEETYPGIGRLLG